MQSQHSSSHSLNRGARSFPVQASLPGASINPPPPPKASRGAQKSTQKESPLNYEELSRIFNTSIITTQSISKKDLSSELYQLTQSPPFKILLGAIRQLSKLQEISERQAAEQLIKTFRKVDSIWEEYVFQEGLEQLKHPSPRAKSS